MSIRHSSRPSKRFVFKLILLISCMVLVSSVDGKVRYLKCQQNKLTNIFLCSYILIQEHDIDGKIPSL